MKVINILSTTMELINLFPTAVLLDVDNYESHNKLIIDNNGEMFTINHYQDDNLFFNLQKSEKIIDTKTMYLNPIDDLIIVVDRKLWYELYYKIIKNDIENFKKLEDLYVQKNVKVFFNFAILEAVNYEVEPEFLYDFKFEHIKITDYELFKNEKNFYYDSFYCMYHLLSKHQLSKLLNPNLIFGSKEYITSFSDIFTNFNIVNRLNKQHIYNHTCLKPRYHRIKFLLEANKNGIIGFGRNNVNIKFIDEYQKTTNDGIFKTDNAKNFSKNHIKYFNKEFYDDFLNIKHKINITNDDPDILYDHLKKYFYEREYNTAYIEIVGETHCIFDLKYGFFTEKSIKPIISQNFSMIYGSNKIYEELKRIGIDLFLDDLNINNIENKNEIEQIDIIVNALKTLNKNKIKKLYIKNYKKLKENSIKLFNHYSKIMNNVNSFFLK